MLRRTIDLLLPALFPSWRFFQQVGPSPRVEFRVLLDGQKTDWAESHPISDHVGLSQMLRGMFWNPERNTQLYMVALAERLVSGLVDHSKAELNRLIAERLGAREGQLQFRLIFMTSGEAGITGTVVYESAPQGIAELRA